MWYVLAVGLVLWTAGFFCTLNSVEVEKSWCRAMGITMLFIIWPWIQIQRDKGI